MGERGDRLPFVGWLRGGNEKQAIEPAAIKDMPGQGKMPRMHGIKGPAKQTYMLVFI